MKAIQLLEALEFFTGKTAIDVSMFPITKRPPSDHFTMLIAIDELTHKLKEILKKLDQDVDISNLSPATVELLESLKK